MRHSALRTNTWTACAIMRYTEYMKALLLACLVLVLASGATAAKADPLYSDEPHCGKIINTTDYTVFGSITTDYYIDEDGDQARYKANFRLSGKEEWPVCSTGPFYAGYMVELDIRTLVPVFNCRTRVTGDILIKSTQEGGSTKTFAECL